MAVLGQPKWTFGQKCDKISKYSEIIKGIHENPDKEGHQSVIYHIQQQLGDSEFLFF